MAEGHHTFAHAGKTYHVSRLTQDKKNAFADISKAKTMAAVTRMRGLLDAEEYETAYNEAMDRINGGAFAFHSPFTQKALKTHGGVLQLACVLFGCGEEEMIKLFRERGKDVRALIDLVVRESNPADGEADPREAA